MAHINSSYLLVPIIGLLSFMDARFDRHALAADFEDSVRPFFAQHCIKCHGREQTEADIRLDLLVNAKTRDRAGTIWPNVLDQLSLGTMPPEDEPRPPAEQVQRIVSTIQQAMGAEIPVASLPGFGNYIDHNLLFREPSVRKAASPARLWRVNPYVFRQQVNARSHRSLLKVLYNQGADGMHSSVPFLTPPHTFRDFASVHHFEDATTELLMEMMWRVSGYQIDSAKDRDAIRRPLGVAKPAPADFAAALREQFEIVMQRKPKSDELERLVDLAIETGKESGVRMGLQTALTAVLLSPESVFRFEVGSGPTDHHGRRRLADNEIALAISFALTDKLPESALRSALEAGGLSTREGVLRQVNRILNDDSIEKPRILRFFQEYFEYTRAPSVFKSGRRIKHFMPLQMVHDTDSLVLNVLDEDCDVLKQLLTTNKFFVNYVAPGKKRENRPDKRQNHYYTVYNLPFEWEWQANQPIELPKEQRAGILTHPAWLLSFAGNDHNQPIQRGRWIQMKLLGGTVPEVPVRVDAQLPVDDTKTLRERMHMTREKYCWRCHQRMDPLGLPFEQFDDFGEYRTTELDRPVNSSGVIDVKDEEIDGSVQDPFELVKRLANSRRVQQVFVRHAFRYWMGRNETLDDAPTLIDAEQAYRESGGSMKALIASLLTSDSFLFRRAAPNKG